MQIQSNLTPSPSSSGHRRRSAPVIVLHLVLAVTMVGQALLLSEPAQAASKRVDKREVEARQAFAAGKYQEALDLYAELYAEKVHPTYLRNIGRCYQNLQQPDKAINAFRDYLRQNKGVGAAERSEIDGYIAEMEAMKKQQEAAQAAAASSAAQTQPIQAQAQPQAVEPNPATAQTLQLSSSIPPPPEQPTPFYKKGWFWGVVGVAVVGGVLGGLYAAGAFSKSSVACTAASGCF